MLNVYVVEVVGPSAPKKGRINVFFKEPEARQVYENLSRKYGKAHVAFWEM